MVSRVLIMKQLITRGHNSCFIEVAYCFGKTVVTALFIMDVYHKTTRLPRNIVQHGNSRPFGVSINVVSLILICATFSQNCTLYSTIFKTLIYKSMTCTILK